MIAYQTLKLVHILSATLMIGTGLGSAFYLFLTYKRSDANTLYEVVKLVILADTIFTFPSVILQIVTGIWMTERVGWTYSNWFWIVIGVSVLVFGTWIKAVFIQLRLRKLLEEKLEISPRFHRLMSYWFYLGVPSFLASMYIYYLMVFKPFL